MNTIRVLLYGSAGTKPIRVRVITDTLSLGAGEAPTELSMPSRASFALGFENDLKISDCSRFSGADSPGGFFSIALLSA